MKKSNLLDSVSLLEFGIVSGVVSKFASEGALEHLTYSLSSNPEISDRMINVPLSVSLAAGALLTAYFTIGGVVKGGEGVLRSVRNYFSTY